MNRLTIACVASIALLASGCASLEQESVAGTSAQSGTVPAREATPTVQLIEGYQITRAYLFPNGDLVPKDNLPNAAIILREGDAIFNKTICDSFVNKLPDEAAVLASNPDAKAISTYWLLTSAAENLRDCTFLQSAYDYKRAKDLSQTYLGKALEGPALLYVEPDGRFVWAYLDPSDPVASAQALENWYSAIAGQNVELNAAPTTAKTIFTFGKQNTPGATIPKTDPRSATDRAALETPGQGVGPRVTTGIAIVDLGYNLFCGLPFDKSNPTPAAVTTTATTSVPKKRKGIIGFVSGMVKKGKRIAESVYSAVC